MFIPPNDYKTIRFMDNNNLYLKSNIMYIKIRVQWNYNDIYNNHGKYTL